MGNAVLPGTIALACADAGVPWGHVSSGCIYTGKNADGSGFTETDTPNFTFRTNNCSFYSGTKALGEEVLAGVPNVFVWRLRIPFNQVDGPRNYLTKLIRYNTLLDAENSISQLDEFVAATFACWEKRVPFGTYNVTNPGHVTTREVVDLIKKTGVSDKNFQFFTDEAEFMRTAAKTPRSNCVMDSPSSPPPASSSPRSTKPSNATCAAGSKPPTEDRMRPHHKIVLGIAMVILLVSSSLIIVGSKPPPAPAFKGSVKELVAYRRRKFPVGR
jgi:hypothetical protein